ncbi:MAG: SpoIIIAH-like family protein [Ruminococcaceae bacterium]|nr:SpoIIIAH-like family protein [Oscillospiraceae bacterium]
MKQQQISEFGQQPPQKPVGKFRMLCLKIGKRNAVIAASVLILGLAVWVNWMLFSDPAAGDGYDGYDQPSGSIQENDNTQTNQGTYFSATQVSRQRARDEAIEVLQAVVDNVEADEAMRAEALAGIASIAEEMQKEADIESLITAKGFEQCVAVLNGESISIVVSADSLQAAQIAQINEIVYAQTGITPAGVTIIHK